MKRLPDDPAPLVQKPIQDVREHLSALVVSTGKRMLCNVLKKKPKDELIDAMFDMVHLPDLLDYFKDDLKCLDFKA